MTTTVIAIDPGVSTGLVIAHIEDGGYVRVSHFAQSSYSNYTDTAKWLVDLISIENQKYWDDAIVVSEQFDLRPGNKFLADLTPVKINSILEYHYPDMIFQTPAQAKSLVKNSVLKNLGWWLTGKDVGQKDANDVRDAFRHLVYYLVHVAKNKWTLDGGWPR